MVLCCKNSISFFMYKPFFFTEISSVIETVSVARGITSRVSLFLDPVKSIYRGQRNVACNAKYVKLCVDKTEMVTCTDF